MPINNDMLHVTNEKKIKLTVGLKFDLVLHKIAMLMDTDAWMSWCDLIEDLKYYGLIQE